jgi:hypothetical protein
MYSSSLPCVLGAQHVWVNSWEFIFGRTVELKDLKIAQFQISSRRNAHRTVFSVRNGVYNGKTSVNFIPFPQIQNESPAGTKLLLLFRFCFLNFIIYRLGPG